MPWAHTRVRPYQSVASVLRAWGGRAAGRRLPSHQVVDSLIQILLHLVQVAADVGFQQGKIGPAPPGVPVVRRYTDKAAEWAASQAVAAGGTLQGYTSSSGAGAQYASYWTPQEVRQADANEQAKKQRP